MPLWLISELPPCELSLDFSVTRQNTGKIGFGFPPQKKNQTDESILISLDWRTLRGKSTITERK